MIVKVYYKCNDWHLFTGPTCLVDGWFSVDSRALAALVKKIENDGKTPYLSELQRYGLEAKILKNVVVMEFGSEFDVFEALAPLGVFINGRWIKV